MKRIVVIILSIMIFIPAFSKEWYSNTITVNGQSNTYYPVKLDLVHDARTYNINIFRNYSETAPADWYTATHYGGLSLTFDVASGMWGGHPQILDIEKYEYTYTKTVAKVEYSAYGYQVVVWLRGGGAIYHIEGDLPDIMTPDVYYSRTANFDHGEDIYDTYVEPTTVATLQTVDKETISVREGNVGIGTDSPLSSLTLRNTNTNGDYISIIKNNDSPNIDIYSVYNGLNDIQTGSFGYGVRPSDDSWQIWEKGNTSDWQNLFSVKKDGKIGVGTTEPMEILEIKNIKPVMTFHSPYVASYKIGNDGSVFKIAAMDNGYGGHGGDFFNNDTQVIAMNTSGNVGIGTVAPGAKLDINEQDYSNPAFRIKSDRAELNWRNHALSLSTTKSDWYQVPYIEWLTYSGKRQAYLGWRTDVFNLTLENDYNFSINGGNVMIGTTNNKNNYRLAVEGTIGAREIVVSQGSWADFVFEPDYKLKTLPEVEAYIAANKHLPDMPSEAEVKEKGANIGDVQAKLLQKIEELTLYVIEQEKKYNELKMAMDMMKKQLTIIE